MSEFEIPMVRTGIDVTDEICNMSFPLTEDEIWFYQIYHDEESGIDVDEYGEMIYNPYMYVPSQLWREFIRKKDYMMIQVEDTVFVELYFVEHGVDSLNYYKNN